MNPSQFLVARRFLRPKGRKSSLTSLITLLSIIGVLLGIMVPIIVLSVMSGFQNEIKDKILSLKGHVTMTSVFSTSIGNYDEITTFMRAQENVVSATPYIEVQGLLHFQSRFEPVLIRGLTQKALEEDKELANLLTIENGELDITRKYYALIGSELARRYYLSTDDRIQIILADQTTLTVDTQTKNVRALVRGVFKTGFQDFDNNVIYISLETLQDILNETGRVNAIDLKLNDIFATDSIVKSLITQFGERYQVFTWKELNHNLFKALALEQTIMYLIMFFIILVAIFNVTSAQLILIIERKKEIGILKTIGMTPRHITEIFLFEGVTVTFVGAVIGGILGYIISLDVGLLLTLLETIINFFGQIIFFLSTKAGVVTGEYARFSIFPEGIYYLDQIPSDPSISRTLIFIVLAMLLSVVSGLFPALKASSMRPVEIMRYE